MCLSTQVFLNTQRRGRTVRIGQNLRFYRLRRGVLLCTIIHLLGSVATAWRDGSSNEMSNNFQSAFETIYQKLSRHQHVTLAVDWNDMLLDHTNMSAVLHSNSQPTARQLAGMMSCMNQVYTGRGLTWDRATHDQLGDLKAVAGIYSSERPRIPVTVATFGSLHRLNQLFAQCLHWQGPLSVVLYEPVLQAAEVGGFTENSRHTLRAALLRVMQMVLELHRHPEICQLRLLLTSEIVHEEAALCLVPLNMLRNLARIQVHTSMMVGLDIDLLPSKSFYIRVLHSAHKLSQLVGNGSVFIVPTFGLTEAYQHASWADALTLLKQKDIMISAVQLGIAEPICIKTWFLSHRVTDFERWYNASTDYPTTYEYRCEPFLLTSRTNLPWHDSRFRGWGEDKIQHMLAVHGAGHSFKVLHDSFTIHRVHSIAKAKSFYIENTAPAGGMSWNQYVSGLFKNQSDRMKANLPYIPLNPPAVSNCISKLWR